MKHLEMYSTCAASALRKLKPVAFSNDTESEMRILNLYDDISFQTLIGFGGAFTESSAWCFAQMSKPRQAQILKAYFDEKNGLGYSICRTHIGSSDFCLGEYGYVDENDRTLSTFSIENDRKYVLPFIRAAQRKAGRKLMLFASPWSPPAWMKSNHSLIQGGKLLPKYMDLWAQYVVRYLKAFRGEGIEVCAITVQNEPKAAQTWESCQYEADDEARLIKKHLVPAFKKAGLLTKIIVWDHNKERVYDRARDILKDRAVRQAVWGIGFHWYSGDHFDAVSLAHHAFPEKVLLETEFCKGLDRKGDFLNDFSHAMDYGLEILGNLNNHMSASVDWNMLLDMDGGPYHNRDGGCIAPVMVDAKKDTIHLLPSYHAIAHFSRFIKRGAKRIGTSSYTERLKLTAFRNPDGTLVAVIINTAEHALPALVRLGRQTASIEVPARSLMTCRVR